MILSKPGQTWSYKSWDGQEYKEEEPVTYVRVRPREQFVKQMLEEHEKARDVNSELYKRMQNVTYNTMSTSTTYPVTQDFYPVQWGEVKSGIRGAVRTQYRFGDK